jgi:tetratricopeptide (TPR) repeat protein
MSWSSNLTLENIPNWIRGFETLHKIPENGYLVPNIPYYFEDNEESFDILGKKTTFNPSHVLIGTNSLEACDNFIEKIMLENGGIDFFFKVDDDRDNVVTSWRSKVIRINKTKLPNGSAVEIDLLPPKNTSRRGFDETPTLRGIHPLSETINIIIDNSEPVLCNLDGAIVDGRFYADKDHNPKTIMSLNEDSNINLFKKFVENYSSNNVILSTQNHELEKLIDDYNNIFSSDRENYNISVKYEFSTEDSPLNFYIENKLLISVYKQDHIYVLRIDNKSNVSWNELSIDLNKDLMNFNVGYNEKEISSNTLNFYNSFISKSESLCSFVANKLEINKYYVNSNSIDKKNDDQHIFIFFENTDQGIQHFNDLISKFTRDKGYLNLDINILSNWINQYKSEINCTNLDGCILMFSKGVNLYRIDIRPSDGGFWNDVKGSTNNNHIDFTYPFSSPVSYNIPEFKSEMDLKSSLMSLVIMYNLQSYDELKFISLTEYFTINELKEFSNSKLFKSFGMYYIFNVFNQKIDILQTAPLKKVFDIILKNLSKFQLLKISNELLSSANENTIKHFISNNLLKAINKKIEKKSAITYFQLPMNKYFKIQDGEFMLYNLMETKNELVSDVLIQFNNKEELFYSMVNESNSKAIELRKKLIGDLPMNLIDRPTNISVDTHKQNSQYNDESMIYYKSAGEKMRVEDFDGAILDFQKVIEIDSLVLPAYVTLSGLKINIHQDYKYVIVLTTKILELEGFKKNPDLLYAQIYDNRGLAKSYLEDEEEAILDFNEALKIDDSRGLTYTNRGFSYMQIGENKLALEDLNKAVDIDNTIPNIYFNRSKCRQSLGDFKGSLEDCNIAIEKDPENFNIIQHKMFLDTLFESGLGDTLSNLKED